VFNSPVYNDDRNPLTPPKKININNIVNYMTYSQEVTEFEERLNEEGG